MTKFILNFILLLLLIAAVCCGLAWLLPLKVSISLLFLMQLLTFIIIGNILRSKNDGKES